MTFVEVKNLSKAYQTPTRALTVLDNVNMNIERGTFVALVGPSGSGKTTFLNMLTGIDTPTDGEVIIDGLNLTRAPQKEVDRWRAKHIGIVFQFFQLLPTVNVVRNVMAPMDLAKVHPVRERKERAMHLLERLGIEDQASKLPAMLSGGQQQRVAVARALANDPAFIIGDELTGNLDRENAANVFAMLSEYSAEMGSTVLVVSYDREQLRQVPQLLELREGGIHPVEDREPFDALQVEAPVGV